ncbi:MAG TPA: STAS domain-containing protein [Acidimicrobiales bacterium]|nr:STAS domain-containing protein [Acidimicrobiales bacterium]
MAITTLTESTARAPGLVVSLSADGTAIATVVALRGEADIATVPVLKDMLDRFIRDHEGTVIIDLADTHFIDTSTPSPRSGRPGPARARPPADNSGANGDDRSDAGALRAIPTDLARAGVTPNDRRLLAGPM